MADFNPANFDWQTGLLAGWTYDKPVSRWFQGSFRAAHRITRPCPTCSTIVALDVTTKALEGKAKNHGLSLRRCKACREALKQGPAEYAERKTDSVRAAAQVDNNTEELETLRMANAVMREELESLYTLVAELKSQLGTKMPWN